MNKDYLYTKSHEWVKFINKKQVICGIDEFYIQSLGEIVYIELPKINTIIKTGTEYGIIESVKSVSDLYAPVSGIIIETNIKIIENPSLINKNCYILGWLLKVKIDNFIETKKNLTF